VGCSLIPQRGYGLQPRVAASATLGRERDLLLNRKAVASALCISLIKRHNRVAVEISFLTSSQGSRSGNPGLEADAPLGHHKAVDPLWLTYIATLFHRSIVISEEFLGQRDDDARRASHVAESVLVLVLGHLADEFGAVGAQASHSYSITCQSALSFARRACTPFGILKDLT